MSISAHLVTKHTSDVMETLISIGLSPGMFRYVRAGSGLAKMRKNLALLALILFLIIVNSACDWRLGS